MGWKYSTLIFPWRPFDKVIDHSAFQRARAIEGAHGHNILEALRLEILQITLHSGALELKHTDGSGLLQQLIDSRIVEREIVHIQADPPDIPDHPETVVDNREVSEAEEVHLQKADIGGTEFISYWATTSSPFIF